ncbi:MAG: hypothetical protein K1060chlam2_00586 [Chlamydiae bacterium]|nr:hypothetical protein [Chlamydiota bacterium]
MSIKRALFLLLLSPSLFASSMGDYKADAERVAKAQRPEIAKIFETLISGDEILPEKDRGKHFDSNSVDQASPFEQQIVQALEVGKKISPMDETEPFLARSHQIVAEPSSQLFMKEQEATPRKREFLSETCTESIIKTLTVEQTKKVTITQEKTETSFICPGHSKTKEFFWASDAGEQQSKWEKQLTQTRNLQFSHVYTDNKGIFKKYRVVKKWTHGRSLPCDKSQRRSEVIQPYQEKVSWEAAQQETFDYLVNSAHCTLVGSSYPEENRRHLIFRCDKGESLACKRIRDRGGQIANKTCIETDGEGECLAYQKTYHVPIGEIEQENHYTFDNGGIWGLNEFDHESEADPNFGEAISRIAALSDIPGNTENNADLLEAEIFAGSIATCKRSFSGTILYDCCGDCRGFAVDLGLAGCSVEERELYKRRKAGKCHYIGTRSLKMGLEKESVYVCFPTVLSRIIQENAKDQLSLSWGDTDEPKANGLTIDQINQINFDAIDFSDFIVRLKADINPQDIAKKIKDVTRSFDEKRSRATTKGTLMEQSRLCEGY